MKKIHTESKLFFSNPTVVRVKFPDEAYSLATLKLSEITRKTYKLIHGTWGHTKVFTEFVGTKRESAFTITLPGGSVTLPPTEFPDMALRAYFAFKDEVDALQFLLYFENAKIVTMWPRKTFTIHEYIESDQQ